MATPSAVATRTPVLEGRAVAKIYRMGEVDVHALRGVDISLYSAELIVLLGVSGSGKSTLLNILGGLDTPTSGTVIYRDHDLTAADERALTRYRREHVGFVFQFYNLIPSLTARENVSLVTEISEDLRDGQHRHRDARRIGEREVALGRHRLGGDDLELAGPPAAMELQGFLVGESRPITAAGGFCGHFHSIRDRWCPAGATLADIAALAQGKASLAHIALVAAIHG